MKSKLCLLLLVFTLFLGLACFVKAQTDQVYWSDDFNYSSNQDMKSAGWTLYRNPSGISVSAGALTLDGTDGDAIVYYHNHFASGIYDWKVETKSMWLGQGHTTNGVFILTEKHSYGFNADGYYKEFAFYRDNKKILHFGIFEEKANQWITIALVREGNTIKMYFNGNLQNTYQEEDTEKSAAIGVDISSPWQGNAKYDYVMLGTPNAVMQNTSPPETTSSFPTSTVLIVGGLAAVVVAGVVIYYFFIAGGSGASTGASAGAGAASTGTDSSDDGEVGGTLIHNHQLSPQEVGNLILHYPPEAKGGLEDGPLHEQPLSGEKPPKPPSTSDSSEPYLEGDGGPVISPDRFQSQPKPPNSNTNQTQDNTNQASSSGQANSENDS
ncbi:MAG: hypothetical protein NWE96_02420 [Candidatus Bathyarchaeota archaeon]|nr:hypothetical protein [Candidatus Bathyarchaeota archaeon]